MNETAIDLNGHDPDGELSTSDENVTEQVDNAAEVDDNSIRALLDAQMGQDSEEPPAPDAEPAPDDSDLEAAEPIEPDASEPPQSWTAAEREAWAEVPEAAKAAMHRREQDFQAGLRTDAELRKVLAPLEERLQGTGVHPDQYVSQLLEADSYIDQQPLQAALAILEKHQLLDQARDVLSQAPVQERPAASDESARIAELEQRIEYQSAVAAATREWDLFTVEHPDALELREVIASKIGAKPGLSYADAYAEAKALVSKVSGQANKASERARISASTKAAGKAGRLTLPRGSSDAPPQQASTGNLREDLEAARRSLGIR